MTDEPLPPLRPLAADFPAASDAAWRALVDKALKGADYTRRLITQTADGIEIHPLYTPISPARDEQPGVAPYTRATASRLETTGWKIGQIRPETTPDLLSAALVADVENGAQAVTIRLAAPAQSGLPPEPAALQAAFQAIPPGRVRVSLAPGPLLPQNAAALAAWSAEGGPPCRVDSLGLDPLGTLAATGETTFMRSGSPGFVAKIPWLAAPAQTLLADARPYHEAGASQAQEIAALLATLVAYLRAAEAEGVTPSNALPRIGLAIATDADLFLGMAKLRATRRLVHRVAQACGAQSAAGRIHLAVTTSQRIMARRDPWVNMLRVTVAATAAALGGADEITVLPFTWALGQPDELSSRIARNVGLVLREEAGLGRIADPAGGAWALEALTDELGAKAWSLFQEIERTGGMLAALASGRIQEQIAATASTRAAQIAARTIELTGVSAFPNLGAEAIAVTPWPQPPKPRGVPSVVRLDPVRLASQFESLRDAADAMPGRCKVFLATLGTAAEHGARTMWMTNLLATAGIEAVSGGDITSSAEAGRLFAQSGARIACICGSDQSYSELAEATTMALAGAGAHRVILAGRPGSQAPSLKAAGLDSYLHSGADVVSALKALLADLAIA